LASDRYIDFPTNLAYRRADFDTSPVQTDFAGAMGPQAYDMSASVTVIDRCDANLVKSLAWQR
jgi:hypothetical protein